MQSNVRAKIQAFGGFLTAMVIPNMGAFIAWGFITALFIPTGWIPKRWYCRYYWNYWFNCRGKYSNVFRGYDYGSIKCIYY